MTIQRYESSVFNGDMDRDAQGGYVDYDDYIRDIRVMADAIKALTTMDVRGHQLQDRLQFSDLGRDILSKIDAANQISKCLEATP